MKMIGNEVYIQQGETWSLDFSVSTEKGHPYTILKILQNPYMVITVTSARYKQEGDYKEIYWLDLDKRLVENSDGQTVLESLKRFISNEALFLESTDFSIANAIATYGDPSKGGNMVVNPESDFDVKNYLFFTDENSDGNYIYKYVDSYDYVNGVATNEVWKEYDFRVIKQFDTTNWIEQSYLFDIKIVSGESLQEYLIGILSSQNTTHKSADLWTSDDWETYIASVRDVDIRDEINTLYEAGIPLKSDFDTNTVILNPTMIHVGGNLQGGIKWWQ